MHPALTATGEAPGNHGFLDAIVLDQRLSVQSAIETAVQRYEARRMSRANGLVRASRRMGAIAQWQHPATVWLRNTAMRLIPASAALAPARKIPQVEL